MPAVSHERGSVAQPEPASTAGALLLGLAHRPLTAQELDAARNCVAASQHTRLARLPNPAMNAHREAEGVAVACDAAAPARVLRLPLRLIHIVPGASR